MLGDVGAWLVNQHLNVELLVSFIFILIGADVGSYVGFNGR